MGTPRPLMAAILLTITVVVPSTVSGQEEDEIFSDGFETGDASRWSAHIGLAGPVDGTYQFAVYDSLFFASGGKLVIEGGAVVAIDGTYFNYDKVDGGGASQCTLILQWGIGLSPKDVGDFESGVEFSDTYVDAGEMTWTLTFVIEDNVGFSGTLAAVGTGFTGADSGCNGTFPTLTIKGGVRHPSAP
jgi:hypothetical protein